MVVCADPIHFQNSGPVIVVGCRAQHVPHVICHGSRGQCVLEWGTFFLEVFRELPRRNVHPVAIPLTPPSFLDNAVNLALIKGPGMSAGTRPCATLDAHIHLVHENFQMLVCPTPWTWR